MDVWNEWNGNSEVRQLECIQGVIRHADCYAQMFCLKTIGSHRYFQQLDLSTLHSDTINSYATCKVDNMNKDMY